MTDYLLLLGAARVWHVKTQSPTDTVDLNRIAHREQHLHARFTVLDDGVLVQKRVVFAVAVELVEELRGRTARRFASFLRGSRRACFRWVNVHHHHLFNLFGAIEPFNNMSTL